MNELPDRWAAFVSAQPRRTYWPTFKSIATLGWFVVAALVLVMLTDVVEIIGRVRDYRLITDIRNEFKSVSIARVNASDDFVRAASGAALAALVVAGVVVIVWFYRARWNAAAYGTHEQRRSQGWAIGGWFCPVISLFYPYQMTNDVLLASEADPGPPTRYALSVSLVSVWWAAWLTHSIFAFIARISRNAAGVSGLRTADVLDIVTSVIDIATATLFILVVRRITRAQARWPAKVSALAETVD
jgi:hypothetical protein